MKLHIDTTESKRTLVRLGDRQLVKTQTTPNSQITLKLIDQLLKQQKLTLKDVTEITVNPGPGSFTGIRVGIAVANALKYALKIGEQLTPQYGSPPHITTPKPV